MSSYENYIKDFPNRISILYDNYLKPAKHDKLEVTFLLSLAASGIAVPLDRLRSDNKYPDPFEDRNTFTNAAKKFDELYTKSFRESELWDSAFEEWRYGIRYSVDNHPDLWPELSSAKQIDTSTKVESVITHLRISLAHGLICVLGEPEIEKILLLKGNKKEGKFLVLTPQSLGIFLKNWIRWLQTLNVWNERNSPSASQ